MPSGSEEEDKNVKSLCMMYACTGSLRQKPVAIGPPSDSDLTMYLGEIFLSTLV